MRIFVLAMLALACAFVGDARAHICDLAKPAVDSAYPDTDALAYACAERAKHKDAIKRDDLLVLIDFKYAAGFPRFFTIDTVRGTVMSRHLTTQGVDSDRDREEGPAGLDGLPCGTLYGAYLTLNPNAERSGEPYVPLRGLTHPDAEKRGVRVAARDYARRTPGRSCGGFMVTPSV